MPEPHAGAEGQRRRWKWPNPILLLIVALTAGLLALAFVRDTQQPWVRLGSNTSLFVLLAPFLAIATAIERFWEAVFGWYESFILKTAGLMGTAGQRVGWAGQELRNAEEAMARAVEALGQRALSPDYPQAYAHFQAMERRLQEAQVRVEEALKSPTYKALKRAITLLGSFALGLGLCIASKFTLLGAAGFQIEPAFDLILTGMLVGSGSGPLHAFIGWLQEFRNTLAGIADVTRGTALKKASEALKHVAPPPVPPPPLADTFRSPTPAVSVEPAQPPASTADTLTHQRQVEHLLSRTRR